MATKTITNRRLSELTQNLNRFNYTIKNIIVRRCEKLAKKINDDLLPEYNDALIDIDEQFCMKDKDGVAIREELVITDKNGSSQRGNTGELKFASGNKIKRKEAINKFLDQQVSIPTYIIPLNETNEALYRKAFELYSYTTLSSLAGIILEIPLDEDGFITDEFADKYSSPLEEKNTSKNGVGKKEELTAAN